MFAIWTFLQGKKTYVMSILIGVDATGVELGWWDVGTVRHIAESLFTVLALRSGVAAAAAAAQAAVEQAALLAPPVAPPVVK